MLLARGAEVITRDRSRVGEFWVVIVVTGLLAPLTPFPGILAWTVQLAGTAAILYWLVRFRRTYASASASPVRSILGPLIVARPYRKSRE